MVSLTSAEAEQLHREAAARGAWPRWFLVVGAPANPRRHRGPVHTADHQGGVSLPGALVADTPEALVAMMSIGLMRRDRAGIDAPRVRETWD